MAQVRITTSEAIIAEDETEKGHYMNHDLKVDILMMAHNCAHHSSIAQTTRNVAALAWFPGVKTYSAGYFDSCSIYLPRRKAHRSVGISIMAARRFKAIQADFVIMDNDVAQKTDMTAIMTLIYMHGFTNGHDIVRSSKIYRHYQCCVPTADQMVPYVWPSRSYQI